MKLVINKCYGGYSLSPEAVLWLYKRGFDAPGFKTPIKEYWSDPTRRKEAIAEWRNHLKGKGSGSLFLSTLSPDEKFVLNERPDDREHPLIVECVETLGDAANGSCASLEVVEIPDGVKYCINEYDGVESIHEKHRSWG